MATKKKKRQNNTLDSYTAAFVRSVLDNPIYCGKLSYGRRHNEKIPGIRNQYHIVKQDEYMLYDGVHEAIISEADWQLAHQQRQITGGRQEKTHSLEHEHILSGILKCPVCGSGMYGNVNRKKKKDAVCTGTISITPASTASILTANAATTTGSGARIL